MCIVMFILAFFFAIVFGIWLAVESDSPSSYRRCLAIGITGLVLVVYCFVSSFLFNSIQHWWYSTSRPNSSVVFYSIPTSKCKEIGIDLKNLDALYINFSYRCDGNHPPHSCGSTYAACNKNQEWVEMVIVNKPKTTTRYDELVKEK